MPIGLSHPHGIFGAHDDSQRQMQCFNRFDGKFRWRDYAHGGEQRMMSLGVQEFVRRFFLNVLPKGFVRIRYCGFLSAARQNPLGIRENSRRAPARNSRRAHHAVYLTVTKFRRSQ